MNPPQLFGWESRRRFSDGNGSSDGSSSSRSRYRCSEKGRFSPRDIDTPIEDSLSQELHVAGAGGPARRSFEAELAGPTGTG